MYDDTFPAPFDPRPLTGDPVHLCPECRDLLVTVIEGQHHAAVPWVEPPDWERALGWLDAQCGGREAVLVLGDRPLEGAPPSPPAGLGAEQIETFRLTAELLDAVGVRFFGDEFALACRRALVLVLSRRPGITLQQRPGVIAHGVTWAVGRANGVLYPSGIVADRALREFFDSRQSGSSMGRKVQVAVRSVFEWRDPRTDDWRWPVDRSPLDPLGHPALLIAPTRRRLLEVRERALSEAAAAVSGSAI